MLQQISPASNSASRKRILLIVSVPPPYHGTNMANQMLIDSDLKNNFDTTVLDISDRRSIDNLGSLDFTNVRLALTHLWLLLRYCLSKRPAAVYILISQNNLAYLRDGLFIVIARLFSPARIMIHLHGGNFLNFYKGTNILMRAFIKGTMSLVNRGIILGHNLANNFDRWVEDLCVVENGTDCLRQETPRVNNSDEITIIFLSNLLKSKGIVDFVSCLKQVYDTFPNGRIRVEIAGSWGEDPAVGMSGEQIKAEVMSVLETQGPVEGVIFLGLVTGEQKLDLLRRADIFVLPSWNEGQPVSLLEAMAAGIPAVVTPVGAIPETIVENETALLCSVKDPQSIAAALSTLIGDKNKRLQMGQLARKRYEESFTEQAFSQRMQNAFSELLEA